MSIPLAEPARAEGELFVALLECRSTVGVASARLVISNSRGRQRSRTPSYRKGVPV